MKSICHIICALTIYLTIGFVNEVCSMSQGQDTIYIDGWFYEDDMPVRITIIGDRIQQIERTSTENLLSPEKVYIAPGLIDCQINGYADVGFSDKDLQFESVLRVTQKLWEVGVTTYLPTVITNSDERIKNNLQIL